MNEMPAGTQFDQTGAMCHKCGSHVPPRLEYTPLGWPVSVQAENPGKQLSIAAFCAVCGEEWPYDIIANGITAEQSVPPDGARQAASAKQ
jgi:hypothetical protein